jgi:hypothetical protein
VHSIVTVVREEDRIIRPSVLVLVAWCLLDFFLLFVVALDRSLICCLGIYVRRATLCSMALRCEVTLMLFLLPCRFVHQYWYT